MGSILPFLSSLKEIPIKAILIGLAALAIVFGSYFAVQSYRDAIKKTVSLQADLDKEKQLSRDNAEAFRVVQEQYKKDLDAIKSDSIASLERSNKTEKARKVIANAPATHEYPVSPILLDTVSNGVREFADR